ncbi:MAG: hypothetical protein IKA58_01360 [Clostridia bacterium]|nr:hypothetical protein [Clostridia bacterium]
MRMSRGMGMGSAAVEVETGSKFSEMLSGLPLWAQSIISILLVIAAAAVVGFIVGKLYAMVKYPDPENHSPVSPKIKVAFIVLLALCCWWLYSTMMEENKPKDDIAGNDPAVMWQQADGPMGGVQGGIAW